ncbi:MAG TPA: GntG family PLP-dependent aldolase [Acidimicrobiales bacterium]|nr:GntG family PLP-dependent aldolase [Acidimicrobiales bacterium]
MPRVDLRSDTVTQPTPAMREAMAGAVVGDDGFGEDPTVAALEARYAMLVGKPAAVFVPSGVMANQIALRVLCAPGDVVVAGRRQHVVGFEMGAAARNASVQFALLDDESGALDVEEVTAAIAAEAHHQPHVALVAVENTHMASGGSPYPIGSLEALAGLGRPIHLDGARLFNASVATGVAPARYAACATTVMSCLSKGLCAPVGSVLAGADDVIARARIERKRLGGAMRQAGVIAAAGLLALDTMVERLADDHARARALAEAVAAAFPDAQYDPASCATNIVAFDVPDALDVVAARADRGVLGDTVGPTRVRLVTHHDVDDDALALAIGSVEAVGAARSTR